MAKAGAFLFVLYLNNFRVFGVLVPQVTKQWFSASENISLTVSSSQRCHKTRRKFYLLHFFPHIKEMTRGWGSSGPVQLPKGPCTTYLRGRRCVTYCAQPHQVPAWLTVLLPKEMFWSAGISESALKFFTEGTKHHHKLQECDLFASLLSSLSTTMYFNEDPGVNQ